MSGGAPDDLELREAHPEELPAIIELCATSLGWRPDDPNERFFRWKHLESPFGRSPMWVATSGGRLVGARVFLRWRWEAPGGVVVPAVRAVDTATHPEAQGRGIFTRLTMHALGDLATDGTAFVFNTPNDKSRPGYLKMGWQVVGRVPVAVRARGPLALARMVRSREGAGKWGVPCDEGVHPAEALADTAAVERLLAARPHRQLRTQLTPAVLRWRYGLDELNYRVLPAGSSIDDGAIVFRLRERGGAVEATLCEALPGRRPLRPLLGPLLRRTGADYVLRVGGPPLSPDGFVRVPGAGPQLTWRAVGRSSAPELARWDLSLGDVELF